MKKLSTKLWICGLALTCALSSGILYACNKGPKAPALSFLEGSLDTIELGETFLKDDYIEEYEDAKNYTLIVYKGDEEVADLSERASWTPDEPGKYTIVYTVAGGKHKGKATFTLTVRAPRMTYTFTKVDTMRAVGDTLVFADYYEEMNLFVDSYYDYEVIMDSVTVGGEVRYFTNGETQYTFASLEDHLFEMHIETEDGQRDVIRQSVEMKDVNREALVALNTRNVYVSGEKQITEDQGIMLSKGYVTGNVSSAASAGAHNYPYIALDKQHGTPGHNSSYGVGDYAIIEFTGNNMPYLAFFAQEYNNSVYSAQGKSGIFFRNGSISATGEVQNNQYHVGERMSVYGPNMVSNFDMDYEKDISLRLGSFASECGIGVAELKDGHRYKMITGITEAYLEKAEKGYYKRTDNGIEKVNTVPGIPAGSYDYQVPSTGYYAAAVTIAVAVWDDTMGSMVWSGSFTTANWREGHSTSKVAFPTLGEEILEGAIVLYGRTGIMTKVDGVDVLDTAKGYGKNETATYPTNFKANGKTYTATKEGYEGADAFKQISAKVSLNAVISGLQSSLGVSEFRSNATEVISFGTEYNVSDFVDLTGVSTYKFSVVHPNGKITEAVNGKFTILEEEAALGTYYLSYKEGNKLGVTHPVTIECASFKENATGKSLSTGTDIAVADFVDINKTNFTLVIKTQAGDVYKTYSQGITETETFQFEEDGVYTLYLSEAGKLSVSGTVEVYNYSDTEKWDADVATKGYNMHNVESLKNGVLTLSAGSYTGSNYDKFSNVGEVDMPYLALDNGGEGYGLNDFLVLEFTGNNMPYMAFLANNYNNSIYKDDSDKTGIFCANGFTNNDGVMDTSVSHRLNLYGPQGVWTYNDAHSAQPANTMRSSMGNNVMGMSKLDANTRYRLIIGITDFNQFVTGGNNYYGYAFTAYMLNRDTGAQLWKSGTHSLWKSSDYAGTSPMATPPTDILGGLNAKGSIVLYGRFGMKTTVDHFEVKTNTTLAAILSGYPVSAFKDEVDANTKINGNATYHFSDFVDTTADGFDAAQCRLIINGANNTSVTYTGADAEIVFGNRGDYVNVSYSDGTHEFTSRRFNYEQAYFKSGAPVAVNQATLQAAQLAALINQYIDPTTLAAGATIDIKLPNDRVITIDKNTTSIDSSFGVEGDYTLTYNVPGKLSAEHKLHVYALNTTNFATTYNVVLGGGATWVDTNTVKLAAGTYDGNSSTRVADKTTATTAYAAFEGNYGKNSYISVDFTGKDQPQIAMFAKNYSVNNNALWAPGKQGILINGGVYDKNGTAQGSNRLNIFAPYLPYFQDTEDGLPANRLYFTSRPGSDNSFPGIKNASLQDGVQYRLIIGVSDYVIENGYIGRITLSYGIYKVSNGELVYKANKVTDSLAAIGYKMTEAEFCHGAFVVYGHFGKDITVTLHPISTNTTLNAVVAASWVASEFIPSAPTEICWGSTVQVADYIGDIAGTNTTGQQDKYSLVIQTAAGAHVADISNVESLEVSIPVGDYKLVYCKYGYGTGTLNISIYPEINGQKGAAHNAVLGSDGSFTLTAGTGSGNYNYYAASNHSRGDGAKNVDLSYVAIDGHYGVGDYIAFEFTGNNMPYITMLAANYDNNVFYEVGKAKAGVVLSNGFTTFAGDYSDATLGYRLTGYGPKMVAHFSGDFLGANDTTKPSNVPTAEMPSTRFTLYNDGKFGVYSDTSKTPNFDSNKQYRMIVGINSMVISGTNLTFGFDIALMNLTDRTNKSFGMNKTMTLDLTKFTDEEKAELVRDGYMTVDSSNNVTSMNGAFVLYGKFGTPISLNKVSGVFRARNLLDSINKLGSASTKGYILGREATVNGADVTIYNGVASTNGVVLNKLTTLNGNVGNSARSSFLAGNEHPYVKIGGNNNGVGNYMAFEWTGNNFPQIGLAVQNPSANLFTDFFNLGGGIVINNGYTMNDGTKTGNSMRLNCFGPLMQVICNTGDVQTFNDLNSYNITNNQYRNSYVASTTGGAMADVSTILDNYLALNNTSLADRANYKYRFAIGISDVQVSGNNVTVYAGIAFGYSADGSTWTYGSQANCKVCIFDKTDACYYNRFDGLSTADDFKTFFTGSFMLWGRGGLTTTIDKIHPVMTNTNISGVRTTLGWN